MLHEPPDAFKARPVVWEDGGRESPSYPILSSSFSWVILEVTDAFYCIYWGSPVACAAAALDQSIRFAIKISGLPNPPASGITPTMVYPIF
jgi:hypothetical protein